MKYYFDQFGLLWMDKKIPVENGILFTAYYRLFRKLNHHKVDFDQNTMTAISWTMPSEKYNYFNDNPRNSPTRFSHDNMKGLYYLFKDQKLDLKILPVFRWNGRIWWHPNGWMVFLAAKSKFWRFIFKPFIYAMIWWSVNTSPENDTSGNNLWFLCNDLIGYNYPFKKEETRKDFVRYITNNGKYDNEDNPLLVEVNGWMI